MKRRVGILGGTFNPVHIGHVRLGLEMAEALGLDAVEFIPAARPPHKAGEGMLPFELRVELLRSALEGLNGFSVNLMESGRPGPSYTWDTLEALGRDRPGEDFHFIMGAGDLLNLHLWKRGAELGGLASLAVATREDLGPDQVRAYLQARPELGCEPDGPCSWRFASGKLLTLVDIPRLDISASFIRDRFRRGANPRFLLPPGVENTLRERKELVLAHWA